MRDVLSRSDDQLPSARPNELVLDLLERQTKLMDHQPVRFPVVFMSFEMFFILELRQNIFVSPTGGCQ